jgi:hypothetical protein
LVVVGAKNGLTRAKSWMLRCTVGRFSMTSCSTFAEVPVLLGEKIDEASAVTVTVSVSVSSCSVTSSDVAWPRFTCTPVNVSGRKLAMFTATVYGPPTRTLRSWKVPSPPLTPSYTVPVGTWVAVTVAPGSTPPCASWTRPVMLPDVTFWPYTACGCTQAAAQTASRHSIVLVRFI